MTTHPPQAALTIEQLVGRMQEEVAREFDLPIAETRCAGVLASVLTPLDESGKKYVRPGTERFEHKRLLAASSDRSVFSREFRLKM